MLSHARGVDRPNWRCRTAAALAINDSPVVSIQVFASKRGGGKVLGLEASRFISASLSVLFFLEMTTIHGSHWLIKRKKRRMELLRSLLAGQNALSA
jgi:hypothetical protein